MMRRPFLIAATALSLAAVSPSQDRTGCQLMPETGVRVDVSHDDSGATLVSVQAREVSPRGLMGALAEHIGLEVSGFDRIDRDPKVSAVLVARPYRDAIRWTLGSVGLRAQIEGRNVEVFEDVSPYPTSEELFEVASTRYFTAIKEHGDWPHVDQAQMALAEIEESLGEDHFSSAVLWYDELVRNYPGSSLVPDALLKSARVLAQSGNWSDSVLRYQDLASLDYPHDHHVTARREIAGVFCKLGEAADMEEVSKELGERALHFLNTLESKPEYVTRDPLERRSRLLVRARALSLVGMPVEALRSLDTAEQYSADDADTREITELRARAFARSGDHSSASTAWLVYADKSFGEQRELGVLNAAQAALEGGHELAVLAIERMARNEGFGEVVGVEATEARLRLGLRNTDISGFGPRANWIRGEKLADQGAWSAAADAFELAWTSRANLDPEESRQVTLAYARSLSRSARLARAIDVLRDGAALQQSTRLREPFYQLASELYEEHQMLDKAIAALKGRL